MLEGKDSEEKNVFHYALESTEPEKALQVILPFYLNDKEELNYLLTSKDMSDETPLHKLVQQLRVSFTASSLFSVRLGLISLVV